MGFAEFHRAAQGIWGCFKIEYDAEDEIEYRARIGGVWFAYGSGAGRTLDEACERALKRYERSRSAIQYAPIEDLKDI